MVAMWLPITLFFALRYEHSIVNMFVIPTGMMLGAKVRSVTAGCGTGSWSRWGTSSAAVFTGMALHVAHGNRPVPQLVADLQTPIAQDSEAPV